MPWISPIPRKAVRKKRPGVRRGQPTSAGKTALRDLVYEESGGRCEVPRVFGKQAPDHQAGVLPKDGHVLTRAHLVHIKAKRVHGWHRSNLCLGCPACHRWLHAGGKPVPPKVGA